MENGCEWYLKMSGKWGDKWCWMVVNWGWGSK